MGLTFAFDDAGSADRGLLGGKGAGLVEMVGLGLPVPPGFVISTEAGRAFLARGEVPSVLEEEVAGRMAVLEEVTGRRFGDDQAPLLVSVRSGAPVSMPGMMDSVLNVGLTWPAAQRLAEQTGDERFAWGLLERLLDGFARTVRGVGAGMVEEALMDLPGGADAKARCQALLRLIEQESGSAFPDAQGQLREAVEAVFRSWMSRRAKAYRKHKGIDEQMGTAVVVQVMVFGNRDERSGSGVAFTRDPSTGASGAYGDFLFAAQGEDVVSGEHDTDTLEVIGDRLPDVYEQLKEVFATLERDARDLCDVEFTIEEGRLYVLQTRVGQRSGRAAVRVAVAMCEEGLIDQDEAIGRVDDEQLQAARAPIFDGDPDQDAVLAQGLAASPGAAVGKAVFDIESAQALADRGEQAILLRPTTSPADMPGFVASVGIVTGRGGRTSHAAVVARGMGRAAVCGVGDLKIAKDGSSATLNGQTIQQGELLSVCGDSGIVCRGQRPCVPAEADDTLARFLAWKQAAA